MYLCNCALTSTLLTTTSGRVISRRNESLLNEFAPQLVESMDARAMLPYLMRYGLADRYDQDVISNPFSTDRDRNMHVIRRAPYKNPRAFENFVKCLEAVDPHSELASQLWQRMSKTFYQYHWIHI